MIIKNIKERLYKFLYKRITNLLSRGELKQRIERFNRLSCIEPTAKLLESAKIDNPSLDSKSIIISQGTVIGGHLIVLPHGGKIEIGEFSYISEGCKIWSGANIKIGSRVAISHNVNIHDTDSHSLDPKTRSRHIQSIIMNGHPDMNDFDIKSEPIIIEDDVWIGFNATILKGVTIKAGSIVGASSVVTRSIPGSVVVAGNPAKIVRHIQRNKDEIEGIKY